MQNVANEDSGNRIVAETVGRVGRLDIVVNNAGMAKLNLFGRHHARGLESANDSKRDGCFPCTRAVITQYRRRKTGGAIVNVFSSARIIGAQHALPILHPRAESVSSLRPWM